MGPTKSLKTSMETRLEQCLPEATERRHLFFLLLMLHAVVCSSTSPWRSDRPRWTRGASRPQSGQTSTRCEVRLGHRRRVRER